MAGKKHAEAAASTEARFPYTNKPGSLRKLLKEIPTKGSVGQTVPVDPLIYRFHEITQVYGTTLKAIIHEMFGDGIMSAIDFTMDVQKQEDPKGDRVVVHEREVPALQEMVTRARPVQVARVLASRQAGP